MTCCTSPDVNLAEEVKFRPIECDRRLCGDFSLRRTNLPANADELLRRFRARACPGSAGFCYSRLGIRSGSDPARNFVTSSPARAQHAAAARLPRAGVFKGRRCCPAGHRLAPHTTRARRNEKVGFDVQQPSQS